LNKASNKIGFLKNKRGYTETLFREFQEFDVDLKISGEYEKDLQSYGTEIDMRAFDKKWMSETDSEEDNLKEDQKQFLVRISQGMLIGAIETRRSSPNKDIQDPEFYMFFAKHEEDDNSVIYYQGFYCSKFDHGLMTLKWIDIPHNDYLDFRLLLT